LLVQRAEDGKWAVPGGYMESGENFREACKREVLEETGLEVNVRRLLSIYTSPHFLLEYPDGDKWQLICLHFDADIVGGKMRVSKETNAFGFFSLSEISDFDMHGVDRMRVRDGFIDAAETVIYDDFDV